MIKLPMKVRVCRNTHHLLDLSHWNSGLSEERCVAYREEGCILDHKACETRTAIIEWEEKGGNAARLQCDTCRWTATGGGGDVVPFWGTTARLPEHYECAYEGSEWTYGEDVSEELAARGECRGAEELPRCSNHPGEHVFPRSGCVQCEREACEEGMKLPTWATMKWVEVHNGFIPERCYKCLLPSNMPDCPLTNAEQERCLLDL